jgi:hypothetical protein
MIEYDNELRAIRSSKALAVSDRAATLPKLLRDKLLHELVDYKPSSS